MNHERFGEQSGRPGRRFTDRSSDAIVVALGTWRLRLSPVRPRVHPSWAIIRVKAGLTDPHFLLGPVELDLKTKTVTEYLEEWRPA
ncbi:hypothetical protein [Rathayibacter sp. AY1A4]|uniref:hypothetical protein n=1 Tax=Rathayibacter sp. AY1A4 TaxID=2080522 RepID=UPI0011B0B781|nr:hypothetical protein [Rathayibacter sp. AY1A4]